VGKIAGIGLARSVSQSSADWRIARAGNDGSAFGGVVQGSAAEEEIKIALAEGNRVYEEKFGRTFIVCATGKSSTEILGTLMKRLRNDQRTELREAAEEQRQITQLRLKKWLQA